MTSYVELEIGSNVELVKELKLNDKLSLHAGTQLMVMDKGGALGNGMLLLYPTDGDAFAKLKEANNDSETVAFLGNPDNENSEYYLKLSLVN
ncbi:hypothetical protein SP15_076 [Bacillus phage SP-15]|uniref:Uncharacterized protein n=1 Tax=Bacillus phage SP-15 TaxID=1792032 RepID=A0A127AW65_9CAUD|nr:hypothetical protein SP15_076 [Bacillus phage SP-15]AMM44875.1 hypothetical protein SP15_076 [Bacillus phage SP-15]